MGDIITEVQDGVFSLRLNRAAKRNALTKAMYAALSEGLAQAATDDSVRCVVISAEGDHFCAGNDILDFAQGLAEFQDESIDLEVFPVFQFLKALAFFEKPLIAAVQGQAAGVGVTWLLHCDLVVAADDIRLSLPFLKLGLIPEAGSTRLLPERIGHVRAFGWMALGEVIGADQALHLGLVNKILPRDELAAAAQAMAQTVTGLSPAALCHTKAFMGDPERFWEIIKAEGVVFRRLLSRPETQAAFAAFLNK